MKKAGIAIDDWKFDVFKRHLDAAKIVFTEHPGLSPGTKLLKAQYDNVDLPRLTFAVEQAQEECRKMRNKP